MIIVLARPLTEEGIVVGNYAFRVLITPVYSRSILVRAFVKTLSNLPVNGFTRILNRRIFILDVPTKTYK